jgi:hypothetical protein
VAQVALRARVLARQGSTRESLRLLRSPFDSAARTGNGAAGGPALFTRADFGARDQPRSAAPAAANRTVQAIVHQSGFDAGAVSRSGARGSLMPPTARAGETAATAVFDRQALRSGGQPGSHPFRQVPFDPRQRQLALAGYNLTLRIQRLWRSRRCATSTCSSRISADEPRLYVSASWCRATAISAVSPARRDLPPMPRCAARAGVRRSPPVAPSRSPSPSWAAEPRAQPPPIVLVTLEGWRADAPARWRTRRPGAAPRPLRCRADCGRAIAAWAPWAGAGFAAYRAHPHQHGST